MNLVFIHSCQLQGKGPPDPGKKEITQRDLYRAARSQQKILLVDGWGNNNYSHKIRNLVENFYSDNWELEIKDHQSVTASEIADMPTMLIGTPSSNSWIKRLIKDLPFEINQGKISVLDHSYEASNHAVVLSYYPNPLNVRMPIGIFTSENEAAVWELVNRRITSFTWGNWNYEVVKGTHRVLLGNLSQEPHTRWEIDTIQQVRLPSEVVHQWESVPFVFSSYYPALNAESMQWLTRACENTWERIKQLKHSLSIDTIHYFLYPSTEIKGLMTGSSEQSHVDFEANQVHTAFDEHFKPRYCGRENQLLIHQLLGSSPHQVLSTGLSVYFSDNWEEHGYQYWAKQLIKTDNAINLQQLMDPEQFSNSSRLVREALSGSLVDFLLSNWGTEVFLERFGRWAPSEGEVGQLERSWHTYVNGLDDTFTPVSKTELPYLQGFNFTHEGYQVFNGYGSQMSARSLEYVQQLGSNAVAIVPYSWMSDPKKPSALRFSNRVGGENDESVVHALAKAKSLGMYTMLKPHVWISNAWPGEVSMSSDEQWEQFFDHYYRWISHYALMAEMHQVDVLCIGVEFTKATLNRESQWRELISKVRGIYHGNLTYAANWGDEFENVSFWDALDIIGLNCYYPLSELKNPSQRTLKQGFGKVLKKVEQVKRTYNKPLVITEIGFRSVTAPWLQPHEAAADKEFNELDQAMAYQAVFEALSESPVSDGILWWKWPTNMDHLSNLDRRFVPTGKKAEEVIDHWFHLNKQ